MIKLKFAELHSPLFLAGTNLQMKLDPAKRDGKMTLEYDREEKELIVSFEVKGKVERAIVPVSNVVSMWPEEFGEVYVDPRIPGREAAKATVPSLGRAQEHDKIVAERAKAEQEQKRMTVTPRPSAQVSTPQAHVFAGPGGGETGQEKPKKPVL